MDTKDLIGKDRAKILKAQKEVKIPVKLTEKEAQKTQELMAKLL